MPRSEVRAASPRPFAAARRAARCRHRAGRARHARSDARAPHGKVVVLQLGNQGAKMQCGLDGRVIYSYASLPLVYVYIPPLKFTRQSGVGAQMVTDIHVPNLVRGFTDGHFNGEVFPKSGTLPALAEYFIQSSFLVELEAQAVGNGGWVRTIEASDQEAFLLAIRPMEPGAALVQVPLLGPSQTR